MSPMMLVARIADEDDDDLEPVRLEEDEDPAEGAGATLLRHRARSHARRPTAAHPARAAATGRATRRRSCLSAWKPHHSTLPRNARRVGRRSRGHRRASMLELVAARPALSPRLDA